MVNLDQVAEPVPKTLKKGSVLIGVDASADLVTLNGIALRFVVGNKISRFLRIRLECFPHLLAARFVPFQTIVVDFDIVKVTQLHPGVVDVVRLVIRFAAEFAVCGVFKKDIVSRNQRIDQCEHHNHDDQHRDH